MQASLAITTLDIDGEGKTIVGSAEKVHKTNLDATGCEKW
jgi:hypothetical protein